MEAQNLRPDYATPFQKDNPLLLQIPEFPIEIVRSMAFPFSDLGEAVAGGEASVDKEQGQGAWTGPDSSEVK